MRRATSMACIFSIGAAAAGCSVVFDLGADSLFPGGNAFVISGTADVMDQDGTPCPVWLGDNGVTYHLFQNPAVANEDFDLVTTPGVRSRLELSPRSDLVLTCAFGTTVEVTDVLGVE